MLLSLCVAHRHQQRGRPQPSTQPRRLSWREWGAATCTMGGRPSQLTLLMRGRSKLSCGNRAAHWWEFSRPEQPGPLDDLTTGPHTHTHTHTHTQTDSHSPAGSRFADQHQPSLGPQPVILPEHTHTQRHPLHSISSDYRLRCRPLLVHPLSLASEPARLVVMTEAFSVCTRFAMSQHIYSRMTGGI